MTTDPEKALTLVVKATDTDGIYNLLNTRANNATIGCQDDRDTDGGLYTTNAHNTITITEAVKAEVTLKISSVGWATLILPFNANLPEGVVAYESNGVENDAVQLVEAESLVANTPYLIKGTEDTYNFSDYGLATKDSYEKELFVGTYVPKTAEPGSYVLQNPKDRGLGFYLVSEEEGKQPTVGAYRSYMKYTPAEGQAASPMFRIGGSTGIDNATLPNSNEVVIYDLMGRKVTTMEKGNMYIINGRKVIVK